MSEIVVLQSDQGKIIKTRQGDLIDVRIDENPTTGYRWEIGTIDEQVIEALESKYVMAPGAGIGGGGTRMIRFRAKSPGISQVQLRLRRPWEPRDVVLEYFSISIQVQ